MTSLSITASAKESAVAAWGGNGLGTFGDGTTNNSLVPLKVSAWGSVIAVTGGGGHSLALRQDGTVWSSGLNGLGQLGDGTTTNRQSPVQVTGLTNVVAIAAGDQHSLALRSDGTVWAWGYNYNGQLGDGSVGVVKRITPVQTVGLTDIVAISTRYDHSLAVRSDGTVWAWGTNYYGMLGDGTTTERHSP